MKVSENTAETPSAPTSANWPSRIQPVAPWWHTTLFVLIIVGISILSGLQSKAAGFAGNHNIKRYVATIAWELILALLAWWGLWMRRTPLREILGLRRSGIKEWTRDFGIGLLFWIAAMIALAAIGAVLRLFHLLPPQKVVLAVAPETLAQALVWIVLCTTAGIVEEFVFRGYLLQQFSSLRNNVWIGIAASSLLFGAAHGYEGIGGMIAITAYGAMFCTLAIYRRSLRAGMIAHAWHDSFTGIALAIVKHFHLV